MRVEELSIDSVLGLLATINIARTRGVSIGAYGDFEKSVQLCDIGEFPQPVSLSFSGQNSRGYIPATPGYIDIKFTGYVDILFGCCVEFSKSGVTPKFGPQGGSNFQVGPHCRPPSGQIFRT